MIIRSLALASLATPLLALSAPAAMAQSTTSPLAPAVVAPLTASAPAPRLVIDPPLAEPLSRGVVFIHYRSENLLLVPVFGPKAVEVSPPIGHLHVALDGAPCGWGNTSGEPLIIFGLPAGPHKLEITLVNPNHQPLGRSVVEFVIPPGVESGWHAHPGEEVGYIIVGQVEMMVQGRATVVLHAGDGFLIPPRTPHNARDIGPETGRMLSTYIVETGQPIATFVDPPLQR